MPAFDSCRFLLLLSHLPKNTRDRTAACDNWNAAYTAARVSPHVPSCRLFSHNVFESVSQGGARGSRWADNLEAVRDVDLPQCLKFIYLFSTVLRRHFCLFLSPAITDQAPVVFCILKNEWCSSCWTLSVITTVACDQIRRYTLTLFLITLTVCLVDVCLWGVLSGMWMCQTGKGEVGVWRERDLVVRSAALSLVPSCVCVTSFGSLGKDRSALCESSDLQVMLSGQSSSSSSSWTSLTRLMAQKVPHQPSSCLMLYLWQS